MLTGPAVVLALYGLPVCLLGQERPQKDPDFLVYHKIQTDASGRIRPWASPDPAVAYDKCLRAVWNYWNHLPDCPNGVRYYLQHQVYKPEHDPRGLGGDQIDMALSSWRLLYAYLGDPAIKADMVRMADFWLDHGMSPADCKWPNLPFPYNTEVHSGRYDGDMRAGKGYLQPDKAGAFGAELIDLYKMTGTSRYLDAAMKIADTLAKNRREGDAEHSPWPFRVHAETGAVHTAVKNGKTYTGEYTSNWTGALRLFDGLIALKKGRTRDYEAARTAAIAWLTAYPMKNHNFGPFFEDIPTTDVSNTEINADTLAWYILEHPGFGRNWAREAKDILDWSLATFGNKDYARFRVTPINEQTVYMKPGNSHTSRHASVELLYAEKTGDHSRDEENVARLNWATYMVDTDGKNRYPDDDIWLTDGYGDYVRHYLRAMASLPRLAPADQNHLLRSTSVIRQISYGASEILYTKFDARSEELIKVGEGRPVSVRGGTMRFDVTTKVLRVQSTAREVRIRLRYR